VSALDKRGEDVVRTLTLWLLALPVVLSAQDSRTFYFPKPTAKPVYTPPMKPVTHLADLKVKHRSEKSWRERLVDDGNSVGVMIQEPAGTRTERHLFADSPVWWAVVEGKIRFEIETAGGGFEVIDASTGSFVYAPERMLHSLEVVGPAAAIRYEVTVGPAATPVYEKKPERAVPGIEFIPVTLSTGRTRWTCAVRARQTASPGRTISTCTTCPGSAPRAGTSPSRRCARTVRAAT
jgi:hypothetical protein